MGASFTRGFGVVALIALGCVSCSDSADCDAMLRVSFNLQVRDATQHFPICDAQVVVDDGSTQHTLVSSGGMDCIYRGPTYQGGTFTVSVAKQGYQPTTTTFTVIPDECGVETQTVELMRE